MYGEQHFRPNLSSLHKKDWRKALNSKEKQPLVINWIQNLFPADVLQLHFPFFQSDKLVAVGTSIGPNTVIEVYPIIFIVD